jgi:lysophospholipase L1-like esterase
MTDTSLLVRNAFLYHLYSGQLFFSAAAIFALAAAADLSGALDRRPLWRRVAAMAALLAIALAALSGTPLPPPLAVAAGGLALLYTFAGFGAPPRRRRILGFLAIAAAGVAAAVEIPWHREPAERIVAERIIVIGDSLSSGGFGESAAWPELLARRGEAAVVNLALPSDTVRRAVESQLPELPPPRRGDIVIVAIGGNDMIEGTPAREFASHLERIVRAASAGSRETVVVELPLLPGRWSHGYHQRRASARHGARHIPKRALAAVLLAPGNTSDGIHLTQKGHEALASRIATSLRLPGAM